MLDGEIENYILHFSVEVQGGKQKCKKPFFNRLSSNDKAKFRRDDDSFIYETEMLKPKMRIPKMIQLRFV